MRMKIGHFVIKSHTCLTWSLTLDNMVGVDSGEEGRSWGREEERRERLDNNGSMANTHSVDEKCECFLKFFISHVLKPNPVSIFFCKTLNIITLLSWRGLRLHPLTNAGGIEVVARLLHAGFGLVHELLEVSLCPCLFLVETVCNVLHNVPVCVCVCV